MSARSSALGVLTVTDTAVHALATCPAGQTVIVKDVRYVNGAAVAENIWVGLHRQPSTYVYLIYGSVQSGAPASWTGWAVLEPGDQLVCATAGGPVTFWASGSVLSGQAPPT